jgi:glycerol uptake facilitator-like aquaporin
VSRPLLGEFIGTGLLLFIVVGSGISAESLGDDAGGILFAHAVVVGLGLAVLVAMFQAVSGSHFNPSVTIALWRTHALDGAMAMRYVAVQALGSIAGVAAANLSFQQAAFSMSTTSRTGLGLMLAETIATYGLVLAILALDRMGRRDAIPLAVGAWVTAVVFATSSTGFANPAVTLARVFTDSYTGIAPSSTPGFLFAQLVAALAAAASAKVFYPLSAYGPVTR